MAELITFKVNKSSFTLGTFQGQNFFDDVTPMLVNLAFLLAHSLESLLLVFESLSFLFRYLSSSSLLF